MIRFGHFLPNRKVWYKCFKTNKQNKLSKTHTKKAGREGNISYLLFRHCTTNGVARSTK